MINLTATLTLHDGKVQVIEIRVGDVRQTHGGTANPWSAAVEILGFEEPENFRIRGRDWAEAIEDAARFTAVRLSDKVEAAGGGVLDPPFLPRPRLPSSDGSACPIPGEQA